jgi:peptidoglycan/LPS O-acetylase OafA/YrhL
VYIGGGVKSRRNFGLDALRCLAIAGVVLAHGFYFIYPWTPALPLGGFTLHLYHLGHAGSMGVELFFVLSGFLIGGLLLRIGDRLTRGRELGRFYVRRWFRTLPNYYVFLGLNVVFFGALATLPPFLVFLQNLTGNHVVFFPESWSLSIEEWFYLLFPFATWILLQLRWSFDRAFLTAGAALYVLSTVLRLVYAVHPANDWANVMREVVVLRFDALMTGIFAAWLADRRPTWFQSIPRLKALAGIALFGFCYCTLYWYGANNETFFARTFRFNLFSLGLVLLFPYAVRWGNYAGWAAKPVELLARWSYAMYFINLPVLLLLTRKLVPASQTSEMQGWLGFAGLILGTIVLSGFWYEVFERRATALRDRFGDSH